MTEVTTTNTSPSVSAEDAYVTEYLRAQDLVAGIEEHLQNLPHPLMSFIPTGAMWVTCERSTVGWRPSSTS